MADYNNRTHSFAQASVYKNWLEYLDVPTLAWLVLVDTEKDSSGHYLDV
jgi:hypothetical protein